MNARKQRDQKEKLVVSLAVLLLFACVMYGVWHSNAVKQQALFDSVSLVLALAMVCTSWWLVMLTSNGRNTLRNYFLFGLCGSLWLLFVDSLAIIWDMPDVIPRLVRLIVYRGLVLIGMLWFVAKLRTLAKTPPQP